MSVHSGYQGAIQELRTFAASRGLILADRLTATEAVETIVFHIEIERDGAA
jgi:hypothetical protein